MGGSDNNKSCHQKIWIGWIKFCRRINDLIDSYFEVHTRFITSHHVGVIIGCILFVLLMGVGGIWFKPLKRNEELFIPQGSQAFKDLEKVDGLFHEKYRVEEFILKRADKGNILDDTSIFQKALELHEKIIKLQDYEDACLKYINPQGNSKCLFVSPLQVFGYSKQNIKNIQQTLNQWLQNPNSLFTNGRPASVNYPNILGSYKASADQRELKYSNGVRVIYYTRYADTKDDIYKTILGFEEKFIDLCTETKDMYKEKHQLDLNYYSSRTRDDAILESTVGDLPLFSVAFVLMIIFCLFVFLRIKNPVTGHLTVGILGVIVIVLGVVCGFGMAMWCRAEFVGFTGILLFLILGIGMDNMFIMIDALESVDPLIKGDERLVIAMRHVGGSITMTTTTDLVAFAVSTISSFPAIHLFCIYASLSIFFAYAMLNTLFLAILTWDLRRIERGQRDVCPCAGSVDKEKLGNPWQKKEVDFSKKLLAMWGEILMAIPMRVLIFVLACGLLGAGIYGTTQITQKVEWKKIGRDGSYFRDYVATRDDTFPAGYSVSVILPDSVDYTDNRTIDRIIRLDDIAKLNPRYEDYTLNWVTAYKSWTAQKNLSIQGQDFHRYLMPFLNSSRLFVPDIKFDAKKRKILGSRVIFFYENNSNSANQAEAMRTIRTDLAEHSGISGIYPVSIMFIYSEMFAAIKGDTIHNLIICAVAILIITVPYLIHPGITALVFLSFVSLLFELMGMMAAWGVSLDAIAMVTIIMSIGFSVDYTCHIAHAYTISTKDSPEERIVEALTTMGSSVLNGGVSTFLGMVITAFSKAEAFRIFFKMMVGIVVLGLVHGLVVLPVMMSIFARRDLRADMANFINPHENNASTQKTTTPGKDNKSYDEESGGKQQIGLPSTVLQISPNGEGGKTKEGRYAEPRVITVSSIE